MSGDTSTPAPERRARRPIGEFLVERGLVTPAQLADALSEQRRSGKRLGEILVERGAITRMVLASVLGEQWEEAGRHLRSVVPLRLAGGEEAPATTGTEELTDSLASLQAAVSRLEELAAGPPEGGDAHVAPAGVDALEGIEAALRALQGELSTLRPSLLGGTDGSERLGRLEARLEELAAFIAEVDEGTAGRLERIAEALGRDTSAPLEELRDRVEQLARTVAELVERSGEQHDETAGELTRQLHELRGDLGRRMDDAFSRDDAAPLEQFREQLEQLARTVAELVERSGEQHDETAGELTRHLGQLRGALEQRIDDALAGHSAPLAELRGQLDHLAQAFDEQVTHARTQSGDRAREITRELGELRGALEQRIDEALGRETSALREQLEQLARTVERSGSEYGHGAGELTHLFGELRGDLDRRMDEAHARDDASVAALREQLEQLTRTVAELAERSQDHDASAELVLRLGDLQSALEQRIDERLGRGEQRDQLEQLARTVAELVDRTGEQRDLNGGELSRQLGELREALDQRLEATAPLRELREELEQLTRTVAELVARTSDGGRDELSGRLEPLAHQVAELAERSREQRGELSRELGALRGALEQWIERAAPLDELHAQLQQLAHTTAELHERTHEHRAGEAGETTGHLEELRRSLEHRIDEALGGAAAPLHELRPQLERLADAAAEQRSVVADVIARELGELRGVLAQRIDETLSRETTALREQLQQVANGDFAGVVTHELGELRGALERTANPAVAERLAELEGAVRAATSASSRRPPELDALAAGMARLDERADELLAQVHATAGGEERLNEVNGRLAAVHAAVQALRDDATGVAASELHGRLDRLEQLLVARAEEPTGDSPAASAVVDRIGQLEELLADVVASRDNRLAEELEQLRGALGQVIERGDGRVDALETLLRDAVHPRLDGLEELARAAAEAQSSARIEALLAETGSALAARLDALEASRDSSRLEEARAELAARDALIAELHERVELLTVAATAGPDADQSQPGEPTSFVALAPRPGGYELLALEGPLPAVGGELDLGTTDTPLVVLRVGRSPLPNDARRCVYLETR